MTAPVPPLTVIQKLAHANEASWIQVGSVAETMGEHDRALHAYEEALRHNPHSIKALTQAAALCRTREQFSKAVDYFQQILNIDQTNGEIWGALGHCFLMMDDLQRAYTAYQQALYHLPNPKEPKLWYGIGILYDRYGSYEHAEEAFAAVIRMEPKFEKANEIYFRLGIIYKQAGKYETSLSCFKYILSYPPKPLTEIDIWFQIGHVFEQQKEYTSAREAYERVLNENPNHAKVLQQLGWLYHQQDPNFANQELAIQYLTRSLEADMNDAQTWYLLGRCYMAQQKYNKAYEAYQQAVYRDGRNPTFWCSIGVLYYQINQYRDALDAYSRAIRLNPYISEVWYDLGTLYESCNNQINDALDAYTRALELDPSNPHIKQRLELLRSAQAGGQVRTGTSQPQPQQPAPRDLKPQGYPGPGGNTMHSGPSAQFYQGPQPPTQMGYSRPPPSDSRAPVAPLEHERLDLQPIQGGGPNSYGPAGQRDEGRGTDRQSGPIPVEHAGSRSSRPSKSGRGDRTSSPKASADRRGGSNSRSGPRPGGHEKMPGQNQPPQLYQAHEDMPGRQMHDIRGPPPQGYTSQAPGDSMQRPTMPHLRPLDALSRPPEAGSRYADVGRPGERPGDGMAQQMESMPGRGSDSPANRGPSSRAFADIPRLADIAGRHGEGSPHPADMRSGRPDSGRRSSDMHGRPSEGPGYPRKEPLTKSNDHPERSPYADRSEMLSRHAESSSSQDSRRRPSENISRGPEGRSEGRSQNAGYRRRAPSVEEGRYAEGARTSPPVDPKITDRSEPRAINDRHLGVDSFAGEKRGRSPQDGYSDEKDKHARHGTPTLRSYERRPAPDTMRHSAAEEPSPKSMDIERSEKKAPSKRDQNDRDERPQPPSSDAGERNGPIKKREDVEFAREDKSRGEDDRRYGGNNSTDREREKESAAAVPSIDRRQPDLPPASKREANDVAHHLRPSHLDVVSKPSPVTSNAPGPLGGLAALASYGGGGPDRARGESESPSPSEDADDGSSGSPDRDSEDQPVDTSVAAALVTLGKRPFRRDSSVGEARASPDPKRVKPHEDDDEDDNKST